MTLIIQHLDYTRREYMQGQDHKSDAPSQFKLSVYEFTPEIDDYI